MSGLWKKYEQKIKAKRDVNTKRKAESNAKNDKKPKLQSDELIVQRLSSCQMHVKWALLHTSTKI